VKKIIFNPSLESYYYGLNNNGHITNSKEELVGKSIFYFLIYGLIIMVSVLLPIAVFIIETEFFDFLNFSSTILISIPFNLSLTVVDVIFLPIFIFYHLHKQVS
jgi:hypothetical protein